MNIKNIIKSYEQICQIIKNDKSEDTKQRFIILFRELDLQLNNDFEEKLDKYSSTAPNLREEIKRVERILSLMDNRKEFRNSMVDDFKTFIGYAPADMLEIPALESEKDYVAYKTNLIVGNEIVLDLIKSGKKVAQLKNQLKRSRKNKKQIEENINEIQKDRSAKLEALKSNEEVLNDLYTYCLTAPFNEENAYIEYIMIKINPKGELKINLNNKPKRTVKRPEERSDNKPLEEMPIVPSLGTVRPNNMLKYMEETVAAFEDITVPTNGLVENSEKINISKKEITK